MKSIIVIGAGMGGLATGIYGQKSGFQTAIFEAHNLPGGQCTSWNRKGYTFDACIHHFSGFDPRLKFNALWRELGALPCEMIPTNECVSVVSPDGTFFHDYYDLEKLEFHLKKLSPKDAVVIDEYIGGIRSFLQNDPFGAMLLGSLWEKLSYIPYFLQRIKYFQYTLAGFAKRFQHPFLQKAFPLLNYSSPETPLFFYLAKHVSGAKGDIAWPRGGSLALAKNMAARYEQLGGTIHYRQKVVKILTENDRACGVELEDGTRHPADFIVSNADGRKTIMQMLSGRYIDGKISNYCEPNPDRARPFSVHVFLGVKRDLSSYPSALILFLDKPEVIGGHACDHLDLQIYGFDASLAPAGKGVIKVELFTRPSYFSRLFNDKPAYHSEKDRIADQVITLLEKQFPGLREDIEVIDVSTLHTWERYMGGTEGFDNFPNKSNNRIFLTTLLGLEKEYTLPGLKNFFFAGGWVTSAGALFLNALTGKTVVQKMCRQCGVKFVK